MSQEGQKDHQGQQPPKPLLVSPDFLPEGEVNTGASKLGQRD
jgi:hypothetical protein